MARKSKKRREVYRKASRKGLFIMFLLLLSSFAYALAPDTPPTISPDEGSLYFNQPILSCSGSTDPEADPINYTFNQNYLVNTSAGDDGTWVDNMPGGNSGFSIGDSWGNATRGWIDDTASGNFQKNVIFTTDDWLYQWQITENQEISAVLTIDATTLWTKTTSGGPTNETYDVSAFNDGLPHTIKMSLSQLSGGPADYAYIWWGNVTEVELQNNQSTIYNWTGLASGKQYWNCKACDDGGLCSASTNSRSVNQLNFSWCPSGNIALNFSLFNEEKATEELFAAWEGTFTLNGTDTKTYSISETNYDNTTLCFDPGGFEVGINGFMQWTPDNASYSFPRQYYFVDGTINGSDQQDINVYALKDDLSTSCTFEVKDSVFTPLENYLIHLQRYSVGEDVYRLVATGLTDANGDKVIYLRTTDAFYRYFVYDTANNLVSSFGPSQIASCPITITTPAEGGPDYDDFAGWEKFENILYNLTFNTTTNMTTLSWDDPTGEVTNNCLVVDKFGFEGSGYQRYNYTCLTTASGTLGTYLNQSGYYVVSYVAYIDSAFRTIASLDVEFIQDIEEFIGLDGVFFAVLVFGILASIGLFSPVGAIMLGIVGLVVTRGMGLVDVSWGAIFGLIFVGLVILFKQRGR